MIEAVARDIVRQWFKVFKKDPRVMKTSVVEEAEQLLGPELVNEIREDILNENN